MSVNPIEFGSAFERLGDYWADLRSTLLFSQPNYSWNSAADTGYAHRDDRFSDVVHLFHRQWLGIRAAAGSLPGNKMAIDAHRKLSTTETKEILELLSGGGRFSRYVFHGMSRNAAALIGALSAAGLSERSYIVHHGSVAQWTYGPERDLAFQAIELVRAGHVKRLHVMKRDHSLLGERSFVPLLLNMSPVLDSIDRAQWSRKPNVFIPGSDSWIKNLHTNALGAAMLSEIDKVLHYSPQLKLPDPWKARLRHVSFVDRSSTFQIMGESLATLNVSLTECYPMVTLESEAAGTPCLRNKLFLDALNDHPYVRMVEVEDPTNPFSIRDGLRRLLQIPERERLEVMRDYLFDVNRLCVSRYVEFLEL